MLRACLAILLAAGCGAPAERVASPAERCDSLEWVADSMSFARIVSGAPAPPDLTLPVGEGIPRELSPTIVLRRRGEVLFDGTALGALGDARSLARLTQGYDEVRRTWPARHPRDPWTGAINVEASGELTVAQLAEVAAALPSDTRLMLAVRHPDPMQVGLPLPAPDALRPTLTAIHERAADAQQLARTQLERLLDRCPTAYDPSLVTLGSAPSEEHAARWLARLRECECDGEGLRSIVTLVLAAAQHPHGHLTALDLSFAPRADGAHQLSIERGASISTLAERIAAIASHRETAIRLTD